MKRTSIVSKFISAFLVSLIVTVAVFVRYSAGDDGMVLVPIFFYAFTYSCFVALPSSYLIDIAKTWVRGKYFTFWIVAIGGFVCFGAALAIWTLPWQREAGQDLWLYGLSSMYLFLAADGVVGILESKARRKFEETPDTGQRPTTNVGEEG